jgi:diguanylate cyclase (GGDEF)-like protein
VANARLYEAERALSVQLSHQVVHDPLTGAANRVLVGDRMAHALARVRRAECSMGVLFIDVDDFKLVNDELGHGVGDLRSHGDRPAAVGLRQAVRHGGSVRRGRVRRRL